MCILQSNGAITFADDLCSISVSFGRMAVTCGVCSLRGDELHGEDRRGERLPPHFEQPHDMTVQK